MGDSNPFNKMQWDGKGFKTARDKVNESFDSLIAGAGNQQGMASGMTGGQAGRVAAETYVNAAGQRNQSEAQILGQEATAEAQFNKEKQQKSAEWESQQAGPLDFIFNTVIPAATGVASMFFPPAAMGTVGSKLIGGVLGGGNKPTIQNQTTGSPTAPVIPDVSNTSNRQDVQSSSNIKAYDPSLFKFKTKTPLNFIKPF